ncbi:hypothetical protein DOK_08614 [gamma proteobacterium BDW918]|nr:hypothetical protein DOK_08614 [gamma proteobacterium BDW918]
MPVPSKLVISGLEEGEIRLFMNVAELLELDRADFLRLLMVGQGAISGGLKAIIPDNDQRQEWRELVASRLFEFINL